MGSSVADREQQVALDARISIAYVACGTRASVALLHDSVPVEAEIIYGATGAPSEWASVKPHSPLQANTMHTLTVTAGGDSSTIVFTTGSDLAVESKGSPSVVVVSSTYDSSANTAGLVGATFELELRRPAMLPGAPRGGVFFLNGPIPQKETATRSLFTGALVFDDGSPSFRVTSNVAIHAHEPTCFFATYEDGAGRLSAKSEPACVTIPGDPPEAPRESAPDAGSSQGCSTGPLTNGRASDSWWLAAVGAVVLARRRIARTALGRQVKA